MAIIRLTRDWYQLRYKKEVCCTYGIPWFTLSLHLLKIQLMGLKDKLYKICFKIFCDVYKRSKLNSRYAVLWGYWGDHFVYMRVHNPNRAPQTSYTRNGRPNNPTHLSPMQHTWNLTSIACKNHKILVKIICSHIYQHFTVRTHYCIVFYHFNNS